MTKEVRPLRVCDVCGGVDDHPRHVIACGPNIPPNTETIKALSKRTDLDMDDLSRLIDDVMDTTIMQRHMDCCREVGCPDGSCNAIADTGAENLRGAKLLKHLTSGAVDDVGANVNAVNAAANQTIESEVISEDGEN